MGKLFDQVWSTFLQRLQEEINATSQADVARRLGVNRGQISKWLSKQQIGGNLKTFLSYAEQLQLDFTIVAAPSKTSRPHQAQTLPDSESSGFTAPFHTDSQKINERAWNAVLNRLQELRAKGHSMAALGRTINVSRTTIKQWLDYGHGGEGISFQNMVHYLNHLNIPLDKVYGVDIQPPEEHTVPPQNMPSSYEKAVASILSHAAQLFGKNPDEITRRAFDKTKPPSWMQEILEGKQSMTVHEFVGICEAIGIMPTHVLDRANELSAGKAKMDSILA